MSRRSVLWVLLLTTLVVALEGRNQDAKEKTPLVDPLAFSDDTDEAELIEASESGGRVGKQQKLSVDEDKKTLSQQVADGKYGLIQKELFAKPSKRPGVISYNSNSEIPKDNINNLGGLSKNDIWLAENHLLVIRGGTYPPHDDHQDNSPAVWPPIDDYVAPNRQVKIPANPKVPPPFPVQLTEDGPLQILGTNSSREINGTYEPPAYPLLPEEGFPPGLGPFFPPPPYPYPANTTPGESPFPIPPYPPPIGPGDFYTGNGPQPFPAQLNGTLPPFFANLPPGAAFLPPPNNQTDPFDEDDPSIYYPPPYSFFFPKDNTSLVPPGPLVPGIVLPPPPNFFAPLEVTTRRPPTTTKFTRPTTTTTTPSTTTIPIKQIHPTTTPLPPTSVIDNTPYRVPAYSPETTISNEVTPTPVVITILPVRSRYNTTTTTNKPYTPVERHPTHRKKPQTVTVLKPVKLTTTPAPVYFYENNEVSGKPFDLYGPPTRSRTMVSTTKVPLKVYFTTSNEIETNSVTQQPPVQNNYYIRNQNRVSNTVPKSTTNSPAQYYYYEEENLSTTKPRSARPNNKQIQSSYLNIPNEYYIPAKQANRNENRQRVQVEIQQVEGQSAEERYRSLQQTQPSADPVHLVQIRPGQVHIQPSSFSEQTQQLQQQLKQQQLEQQRRLQQQRLEQQRIEQLRLEKQRVVQQRFEEERLLQQQLEKERAERQRLEQQRIIQQKEDQRIKQQQIQQEQVRQQKLQQQYQEQTRQQPQEPEPQYYYVTSQPYTTEKPRYRFVQTSNKPDTFGLHIARIKEQIQSYYTTPKTYVRNLYQNTVKPTPKPVYQFSFEAANYKQQHDAFQNPKVQDNDKFRPHYSVQIQPAVEIIPTQAPIYQNTPSPVYYQQKVTSERPVPSKYYSTRQPEYEYEDEIDDRQNSAQFVATPRPISQYSYEATPNPVYQQSYYTKQDEGYFDDRTKKYFTIFGQKIPGNTTPLSRIEATTANPVRRPVYSNEESKQNVQIEYAQSVGKPISLEGDTLVNYVQPRPPNNPNAEYIQVNQEPRYPQVAKFVPQQRYEKSETSLHGDIKVNYKPQRPTPNPNAEIVQAINVPVKVSNSGEGKAGSYISYQLPGDEGAHFYFLTPQLAQRRDQGAGFFYSQPKNPRVRRSDQDQTARNL